MKITPELVPHSEFHKGIWLLSLKRPSWYYFKRQSQINKTISSRGFLATVDQPLRKLVKFLHQRDIQTTASCSGHDMNERNFEKIFPALEKDAEEIRSSGLSLKDVESGKTLLYKDETYSLPWTKKEFVKKLEQYQHIGVLGIRTGHKRSLASQVMELKIEGVRFKQEPGLILIFTNEQKRQAIYSTWKEITEKIRGCFEL